MQSLNILEGRFSEFNAFSTFETVSFDKNKRGLQLLEQLQTTLDLKQLLNKFAMEAAKYIDFSGLTFSSDCPDVTVRGSRKGKYERQFELVIENNYLGTLTYAINSSMSSTNYKILKELHQYLLYPIKNAIAYNNALMLAMQDGLTGLGNRRYFDKQLHRAITHSNRQKTDVGLVVCDLNKFKAINDSFGHHIGDNVLIHFANALKSSVRESDSIFRFGGDEFVLLVEDASRESLDIINQRIHQAITNDPLLMKYQVTCSLGATFLNRADTAISFFERADQALYRRKMNMTHKLSVI
ncbi:GGDEF domain-containing protein [Thalassotalea atypica]|uniref:GGDEF domain-containing protein n=1 Tax=Thalassotalea atypica TaxID=2054316 RepID=UPI0025724FB6|nr:GGDEF domain-containing protein [Thalassotalea atypica]